jgi:hypothetical protein
VVEQHPATDKVNKRVFSIALPVTAGARLNHPGDEFIKCEALSTALDTIVNKLIQDLGLRID